MIAITRVSDLRCVHAYLKILLINITILMVIYILYSIITLLFCIDTFEINSLTLQITLCLSCLSGVIGGVPDYDHLTRVQGEQDRPNVYDVIPVYDEIST